MISYSVSLVRKGLSKGKLVAACLFLLSFQGILYAFVNGELIEDAIRTASKAGHFAPEAEVGFNAVTRAAKSLSASEAAISAFRSLKSPAKYGVYIAREGTAILYLGPGGKQLAKWGLNDGTLVAQLTVKLAHLDPQSLFDLLIEAELFTDPKISLSELPSNVSIRYVDGQGNIAQTRLVYINGKAEHVVEWDRSGTLFIDMRDADAARQFADIRDRPFEAGDVSLLTLLDRRAYRETVNALENAAMERGIQHTVAREKDIEVTIRESRHKLLLVVGHTEGEGTMFVVRGADDSVLFNVSIERLSSLAKANDVTVILLGCRTGVGGLLTEVDSLAVAACLKRAFGARRYSDFFTALGTSESPFVVTTKQINGVKLLVARRLDEENRIARASLEASDGFDTVTVLSVGKPPPISFMALIAGLFAGAVNVIILILLIGMVLSVLSLSVKPLKWSIYIVIGLILVVPILVLSALKRVTRLKRESSAQQTGDMHKGRAGI